MAPGWATPSIGDATGSTLLGGCESRRQRDGTAQLSWWVFPQFRRRGLASRGVPLVVRYMDETLAVHRFVVSIEADNAASRAVARNVGFLECGTEINEGKPMLRYELLT